MLRKFVLIGLLFASSTAWCAATPRSSAYDSRIQTVAYSNQNTTIVNTRPGYITTLLFNDGEEVIEAQAGFPKGWTVTKSGNRVGVSPNPVTQPVTDASGTNTNTVFLPTAKEWKTNLLVVTSMRVYSLELNVLDSDSPSQAFVIRYRYPDDDHQKSEAANAARQKLLRETLRKQRIAADFAQASMPRNWHYTKRVTAGSESIAPDFTYDDSRFTYLGFSAAKTLPSVFRIVNGEEQTETPQITRQDNYTLMAVRAASSHLVLRYGSAVVGIENMAFGQAIPASGDTVSSTVTLEAK